MQLEGERCDASGHNRITKGLNARLHVVWSRCQMDACKVCTSSCYFYYVPKIIGQEYQMKNDAFKME